jgi:pyruvate kinase
MDPRRAKIVCTIGPSCDTEDALVGLIEAGMDMARLNFSHGTHEDHQRRYDAVRAAAKRVGRPVAILQDLCGPKIRSGQFHDGTHEVATGDEIVLVEGRGPREDGAIPIVYTGLAEDVHVGDPVLVDDGRLAFRITRIEGTGAEAKVHATVEQGGALRDRVGISLPSRRVRLAALTEKDKADLSFGLRMGVDYVALSFVRSAEDVKLLREICEAWGRAVPIISKVETPSAVEDIDAIAQASDGMMVARGDLGVELPPEQVPVVQKRIIAAGRKFHCPVIVATEMLHSMQKSARPTRAEASDVAHAIFDGADAVMLSGETATGDHPNVACSMMARIIREAERSPYFFQPMLNETKRGSSVAESIARNAVDIAEELGARLVVAFTESGASALLVSKARPQMPIVAFSPQEATVRNMALFWGVVPNLIAPLVDADELVDRATGHLLARGLAYPGDRLVVVFGAPLGVRGSTNTIRVRVVS